jgi:type I restriction enzyme S subunit
VISRSSLTDAYPRRQLGDVVEFLDSMRRPVTESDRRAGPYPYYGANGRQGTIDDFIFDEPLVLLAEDGGHFDTPDRGIAYRVSGKTWVNNHAHVLRPKECVDIGFLCRVLENYDVTPWVTGTTRGKLTQAGAAQIVVPLPPLPEQRRIAEILDKADTLRTKRRAALAQLDTLTQSIFLDMFGDPATNDKNWRLMRLGECAVKFSDGPFGSNLKSSHYTEAGVRVVRLQNIGVGEFLDSDTAFISEAHFQKLSKHECRPGDVLVGTLGDPNLRACIQPEWLTVALNKADCVQIRPDSQIATSHFLCTLLNLPATERMAQDRMHGQTRVRISMGRLRDLVVPMPPVEMQREFARRISAVSRIDQCHRDSLRHLDEAFAALQGRAFRGAL